MKKRGRPRWVPDGEFLDKVEKYASRGLTEEQIAHNLGYSSAWMSQRKQEYTEIDERIKTGRAKGIALIANKVFELAAAGNLGACCFYLKCRAGWREEDPAVVTVQPIVYKIEGKVHSFE